MKIMLCIPTFLVDRDIENNTEEEVALRQSHLASFKYMVGVMEKQGHRVYCALREYRWCNSGFAKPIDAVARDWTEVQSTDHVVACPVINGAPSKGVHVEIGWATALGKPLTVLVHRPRTKQTVLVTGLRAQSGFAVGYLYYKADPLEIVESLLERLAMANAQH